MFIIVWPEKYLSMLVVGWLDSGFMNRDKSYYGSFKLCCSIKLEFTPFNPINFILMDDIESSPLVSRRICSIFVELHILFSHIYPSRFFLIICFYYKSIIDCGNVFNTQTELSKVLQ